MLRKFEHKFFIKKINVSNATALYITIKFSTNIIY
jgi:hypothetical protein